jgi:hypothetical protein
VPDEAWLCQGEDDHVGGVGTVKACPIPIDPSPAIEEEAEDVREKEEERKSALRRQQEQQSQKATPQPTASGVCPLESSTCKDQRIW